MTKPISNDEIESAERLSQEQWAALRRKTGRTTTVLDRYDDLESEGAFLGYQKRLLQSTALYSVVVIEKSRRIGATWALAADAVLLSSSDKADGGMDTLYIGYNLDMAREFIDTCATWANQFNAAIGEIEEFIFTDKNRDGTDREIQAFRVKFQSGFEIVALSSNARSFRGRQGFAIIDEAAFHDDLDELIKAAMAFLIWGGKICIISTHDGEDNTYNKLVEETRAQKKHNYKLERIDFDDAIRDGLYERVCQRKGDIWTPEGEAQWREDIILSYGEGADEELFCIPSKSGGTYLPGNVIRRTQKRIPVLRWQCADNFVHLDKETRHRTTLDWLEENVKPLLDELDPHLRYHAGSDFGRVSDLTAIWPVAVERTMKLETPFVVEMRNVPFENQFQVFCYIFDGLPKFMTAALDGGGNGAHIAELLLQKYGAERIEIILFNKSFYLENFPVLKATLEDQEMTTPKDDDIYNDFRAVKKIRNVPMVPSDQRTIEKANKGRKRHGDAAIAALLARYAVDMETIGYGHETEESLNGDRHDDDDDLNPTDVFLNSRQDGML